MRYVKVYYRVNTKDGVTEQHDITAVNVGLSGGAWHPGVGLAIDDALMMVNNWNRISAAHCANPGITTHFIYWIL